MLEGTRGSFILELMLEKSLSSIQKHYFSWKQWIGIKKSRQIKNFIIVTRSVVFQNRVFLQYFSGMFFNGRNFCKMYKISMLDFCLILEILILEVLDARNFITRKCLVLVNARNLMLVLARSSKKWCLTLHQTRPCATGGQKGQMPPQKIFIAIYKILKNEKLKNTGIFTEKIELSFKISKIF